MNNLPKPVKPMLPGMPELFRAAMPEPLPEMSYESGIVTDFFDNWKRGRLREAAEKEAEINEYRLRSTRAKIDAIKEVMQFPAAYQDQMDEYEFKKKKRDAEISKLTLENQMRYFQVEQERIACERAKEEVGG